MRLLTALAVSVVVVFALTVAARASVRPTSSSSPARVNPQRTIAIRARARAWETLTGVGRARSWRPLNSAITLNFWRRRLRAVSVVAHHPPHLSQFRCIHGYEGSWRDTGDPYWGGLQMDRGFMSAYAPLYLLRRGFANAWTPLEQIWVAERAYRSGRGFYAWPNTARYCGLI